MILIAITLIAAIAIAGFVFGLFGSFTSSAQVQASVTTCTYDISATTMTCNLQLTNSGSVNTAASSCSNTAIGVTTVGVLTGAPLPLTAGGVTPGVCVTTGAGAVASGAQVVGSLLTTNGASVPFTGIATAVP